MPARPMSTGNINLKCQGCNRKNNLKEQVDRAEREGLREIRCPACNTKIGELN